VPIQPPAPATVAEAMEMAQAGLARLATADVASLPTAEQAECLLALERMESWHTAGRARVLGAFSAQAGYEDDGHGSARSWLRWQTRVTSAAAGGALGWSRRLSAHPAVAGALARAEISPSWARQLCDWTDLLPEANRDDADAILLGAAAAGADLPDLDKLAEEMRRRCAPPDGDDGGFPDRDLRLETTLGGAGKLDGDLTPQCTAALKALLEALGKKAGPEDLRTKRQRDHDALEEACRRLIASGCHHCAHRLSLPASPGGGANEFVIPRGRERTLTFSGSSRACLPEQLPFRRGCRGGVNVERPQRRARGRTTLTPPRRPGIA
jgi:Domain of unknown function (DUF222)